MLFAFTASTPDVVNVHWVCGFDAAFTLYAELDAAGWSCSTPRLTRGIDCN